MAVGACLSPFPSTASPSQRAAAIEALKAGISGGANLTDDRVAALGEAASSLVERFSPDAPDSIRNEATVRCAGWMHARVSRPLQGISIEGMRLDFRERFYSPNALVNSGARAILEPWRVRRALPVEEDTS